MFVCEKCGDNFTRKNNLERHKKQSCDGSKKEKKEEVYIPTFSGSEFGTGKPKSKETMAKIERLVQSRIRSRSPHRSITERNIRVLGQKPAFVENKKHVAQNQQLCPTTAILKYIKLSLIEQYSCSISP